MTSADLIYKLSSLQNLQDSLILHPDGVDI